MEFLIRVLGVAFFMAMILIAFIVLNKMSKDKNRVMTPEEEKKFEIND